MQIINTKKHIMKHLSLMYVFLCILSLALSITMFFIWNQPKKCALNVESAKEEKTRFNINNCSITPEKIFISGWVLMDPSNTRKRVYVYLQNKKTDEKIEVPSRVSNEVDTNKNLYGKFHKITFSAALNFLGHKDDYSNIIMFVTNGPDNKLFRKIYVCQ